MAKCANGCGRDSKDMNSTQLATFKASPCPGMCASCTRSFHGPINPVRQGSKKCPSCARSISTAREMCPKCTEAGIEAPSLF